MGSSSSSSSSLSSLSSLSPPWLQRIQKGQQDLMNLFKPPPFGRLRIKKIYFYQRPVNSSGSGQGINNTLQDLGIVHHQVIIQFEGSDFFIRISFTNRGLEIESSQKINNIEKKNSILKASHQIISKTGKDLVDAVLQMKKFQYNVVAWNCQHYTDKIIKKLRN